MVFTEKKTPCRVIGSSKPTGGINETISLENGIIIRIKDSEAMANHIENIIKGNLIFDKKTISSNNFILS